MGILNAQPKLDPGEALVWKSAANHIGGPSYALWGMNSSSSGQLAVTDRRVFFQPSRIDRLFLEKRWERPLEAIDGFEIVERAGAEVVAGGMRDRLGIRTEDGVEIFVVNKLEKKLTELRALLGA